MSWLQNTSFSISGAPGFSEDFGMQVGFKFVLIWELCFGCPSRLARLACLHFRLRSLYANTGGNKVQQSNALIIWRS